MVTELPSSTSIADALSLYVGGVDESIISTDIALFFHCSPPKFDPVSESVIFSAPSVL